MSVKKPDELSESSALASQRESGGGVSPAVPADILLERTCDLIAPLAQLLVSKGVGYTQVAHALKLVFLEAARQELQASGGKQTDAALSLLSGLHRKDVRAFQALSGPEKAVNRALSLAEQVFTRWATDAAYLDAQGNPAILPFIGAAPSFDALVNGVSKDFSRRTVLEELVRLGLVSEQGDSVVPLTKGVVPTQDFSELSRHLAENVHDHLAAASANVRAVGKGEKSPFLEHSMYANGLSPESIELLARMAKSLWQPAFGQMVDAARQRYALDEDKALPGRMRFGVYFYSENK